MGKTRRGVPDGTGPYQDSRRRMGRRQRAGYPCPFGRGGQANTQPKN